MELKPSCKKKTITYYFQKKISVIEDSQIVLSPHPIPSSSEALTLYDEKISVIEDSQIVLSPYPIPSSSEALTLHEGINYEDIQSPSLIQLYKKKESNDPFI
ncbi:uncharacterized protein LOC135922584 [Gordionus sp. m RMFG-2023]|uniref:uncharacterized protein LOC135922584 n=1 Tax=Gordionus sp. m RMFG-2023 TaxID=3053472 RepID=UPI0031FD326B